MQNTTSCLVIIKPNVVFTLVGIRLLGLFCVVSGFVFIFETGSGLELTVENSLALTQKRLPQIYECWD